MDDQVPFYRFLAYFLHDSRDYHYSAVNFHCAVDATQLRFKHAHKFLLSHYPSRESWKPDYGSIKNQYFLVSLLPSVADGHGRDCRLLSKRKKAKRLVREETSRCSGSYWRMELTSMRGIIR